MNNNAIVIEPTDAQLAALNDELAYRNAKRPGNNIPTVAALVTEMINDLVRDKGPSVELLKAIMQWWAMATPQERAERMAKAGFEVVMTK